MFCLVLIVVGYVSIFNHIILQTIEVCSSLKNKRTYGSHVEKIVVGALHVAVKRKRG